MSADIHPLTPDRWDDLVTVFGGGAGKGDCGRCWCMWWRLPRTKGPGFSNGLDVKALFHARVMQGPPPGLLRYADGAPVGWVQVGPRADVPEWNVAGRLTAPPEPTEAADPAVWGVTCFVTRTGHRKKGHARALLDAAIAWARDNGARVLDGCPVETADGKKAASALYHGPAPTFREAGFREIARRREGRPLMRLALT
ncbi:MAG: GNAT family N-acetyltransferase [Pseudomonadota bacterium]